jgi:hypothetical protein
LYSIYKNPSDAFTGNHDFKTVSTNCHKTPESETTFENRSAMIATL